MLHSQKKFTNVHIQKECNKTKKIWIFNANLLPLVDNFNVSFTHTFYIIHQNYPPDLLELNVVIFKNDLLLFFKWAKCECFLQLYCKLNFLAYRDHIFIAPPSYGYQQASQCNKKDDHEMLCLEHSADQQKTENHYIRPSLKRDLRKITCDS